MRLVLPRVASTFVVAVVVACSAAPPPELTDTQVASMYEEVAARICGNGGCGRVFASETLPDHVKDGVVAGVGDVEFLSDAEIGSIMTEFPPNSTFLFVGNLRWHLSDVVGIEFGSGSGSPGGTGTEYLFRWNGIEWVTTTPDAVGVTVTSWVS